MHNLPRIAAKHNASIKSIPILFAGLLNSHGNKGPAEIAAKRRYTFLDTARLCSSFDLPYKGPPTHPFNPLLALRMATAIDDDESRFTFASRITQACWGEGKDISDVEQVIHVANECKLDGMHLYGKSQSSTVKTALKDATADAVSMGVFGVPTFIVDDELFFGSDRIDLLDLYLDGKITVDKEVVAAAIKRPRGADRKAYTSR